MSRFQLRRAHVAVASAVVLVALACSKSDAPPADTTAKAPDTSAAASVAPQALVGAARGLKKNKPMPGDLTKPIDDYTGDEFRDLVKKLSFVGGHERPRKCKDDPACSGSKRTLVLVDAVATQDSLSASTAPQFGIVYVRAINKGDAPEARYGMLPSNKQYEYYMIVTADSAGTGMQWRLEQFDSKARTHSKFGEGKFVPCNHAWVAGAKADFKTCANSAAAHDSVMKLGLNLQGVDGDPIWASCAMGCCIGQ
ncbi:MAG: hypothetical protein JWL61_3345 [Gemmatimonadetes bacterium]|nr:hypothetical protein [Gemmatimonadota bacterium]